MISTRALASVAVWCSLIADGSAATGQNTPAVGGKSLDALIGQLKSPNAVERAGAATAIADLGPGAKAAVPALTDRVSPWPGRTGRGPGPH